MAVASDLSKVRAADKSAVRVPSNKTEELFRLMALRGRQGGICGQCGIPLPLQLCIGKIDGIKSRILFAYLCFTDGRVKFVFAAQR